MMPTQLFVEAADPLLLLSDTVSSMRMQSSTILFLHLRQAASEVYMYLQVRHVCAGTAARTMAQAIIHPIDTVKTRLQVWLVLVAFLTATARPFFASNPPTY